VSKPGAKKLPRDLFETRTHTWQEAGLSEELEPGGPRRAIAGTLVAIAVIAATLFVYERRQDLLPGFGPWVKGATVLILVVVGTIAIHWLVRGLSPRLFRRLDPATAGTIGFLIRLFSMSIVVIVALRLAGVTAATLALGGTITAVVLGLAAQQSLGGIFAGIVLQSTRPFRVGDRVRLVGGLLGNPQEGTISSLGLFYTTLAQGADRLRIPNSVLLNATVVPIREPDKVDIRARFKDEMSPRAVEQRLGAAIEVPTRYAPQVWLEEVDDEGIVLRIVATPLRPGDGSQLAEEVLAALRPSSAATVSGADDEPG
jgi:small-conductance mechanosensitive channel